MIIETTDGFAFGTKSSAVIITKKNKTNATYAAIKGNDDEVSGDVAFWGVNNDLPKKMMQDVEATGVLSAATDTKARIAVGKGPLPARIVGYTEDGYEQLEFVADAEIHDWLEMNNAIDCSYASVLDLFRLGNCFRQILLSSDRKIIGYKRQDASICRLSRISETTRRSDYVYMSGDWDRYTNMSDKLHTAKVPLLDNYYPLLDLQARSKEYTFMFLSQYNLFGRQYYAPSPWYVAKKWVDIAQSIPEMKEGMFENQMTIKYVVEIHPKFWDALNPRYSKMPEADQKKLQQDWYDKIDQYLTGPKNSYKSIFTRKVFDDKSATWVPGITIEALDDKVKDGKLIPDAGAANSEILFALAMNPALMGVNIPGSGTNVTSGAGSNIREAYLVQIMLLEMERRMDSRIFDLAKITNGWQARLGKDKPLVLRYPNQILTTLNTGANTQPTA